MREAFSTGTDFPLCSKCSLSTVHVSETKPLLAWCFPYETLDPIFLLPSAFLLSILNYSHSSCTRLQMSDMFSSKQHKFSRLTGKAKRKKRQNLNKNYLVLFTRLKQVASSAGLAHFKLLHSHRTRTKPLSHAAHPVPRGVGTSDPESSSKPEVPRQGEWTDSKPAQHLTGSSWAKERETRSCQETGTTCFCASCVSTGIATPCPEEGRAGAQVRDQKYPDTAHSIM